MKKRKLIIGWREWVDLNQLGLPHIKAKIDTGAKTSCLHAFEVRDFEKGGLPWVRFSIHPHQHDLETYVICEAPVIDRRWVTDSGGHRSRRYVIETELSFGGYTSPVELTLTNRDTMKFRMLIGRNVLSKRFLVDVSRSFCLGGSHEIPPGMPSDEEEE